jgi:hypothetical protein
MKSFLRRFETFIIAARRPWCCSWCQFLLRVFVWRHGFYWDDLPVCRFVTNLFGSQAYFPPAGMGLSITTKFILKFPFTGGSLRSMALAGSSCCGVLRDLWPDVTGWRWSPVYSLLYPVKLAVGLVSTSHFYIVICVFFSYLLILWSLRKPGVTGG